MGVRQPAFGGQRDSEASIERAVVRNARSRLPRKLDKEAKAFVEALLAPDPTQRLSSAFAARHHACFAGVNWDMVAERRLLPPYNPNLKATGDSGHFAGSMRAGDGDTAASLARPVLSRTENALFDKFG